MYILTLNLYPSWHTMHVSPVSSSSPIISDIHAGVLDAERPIAAIALAFAFAAALELSLLSPPPPLLLPAADAEVDDAEVSYFFHWPRGNEKIIIVNICVSSSKNIYTPKLCTARRSRYRLQQGRETRERERERERRD